MNFLLALAGSATWVWAMAWALPSRSTKSMVARAAISLSIVATLWLGASYDGAEAAAVILTWTALAGIAIWVHYPMRRAAGARTPRRPG